MNRKILQYGRHITAIILIVFAWVIYRRLAAGGTDAVILLAVTAVVIWFAGTILFIHLWPLLTVNGFKRAILKQGFDGHPIPANTIYAVSGRNSRNTSGNALMAAGTDDLLYVIGWLDVKAKPLMLHVPDMDGRYYSIQFTDPASGSNFAYVGKRVSGTGAGIFLLHDSRWKGNVPEGVTRIAAPHGLALVIGRVFAADDDDRLRAYAFAKQIQFTAFEPV